MRVLGGLQRTTQKKAVAEGVMRCHLDLDLRGASMTGARNYSSYSLFRKKINSALTEWVSVVNSCLHPSTCRCRTFPTLKLLKDLCWRHFIEEESSMFDRAEDSCPSDGIKDHSLNQFPSV